MEEILADSSKFKLLAEDPIKLPIQRDNKIKRFLRSLKKFEAIFQTAYEKFYLFGSQIGILYGLRKTHKNNVPMRPILSSINTHSYKVVKFLVPLLRPISSGIYTLTDSFSFVKELLNLNFDCRYLIMASFDTCFLFTNIPLDETTCITINHFFHNCTHYHSFFRN